MPPVGFEPTISAGKRPQTYAPDRTATATGTELKFMQYKHQITVYPPEFLTQKIFVRNCLTTTALHCTHRTWGSQLHDRRHQTLYVVIIASHGPSTVRDESPAGSGH